MKYMLLIYADVSKRPNYTPEELKAAQQKNNAHLTEMHDTGVLMQNEGWNVITDVRTVRVRHNETMTADTLFAETQEQLTSYIMLDCKDLDEAISWVAKNPAARYGSIEVRPVGTSASGKAEAKVRDGRAAVDKS
jgi:hypothetical protein